MKKARKIILLSAALLLCLAGFALATAGGNETDQSDEALLTAIHDYLVGDPRDYAWAECFTSGNVLLAAQQEGDTYTVYTITSVEGFQFFNENFVCRTGSWSIPCRFTLTKEANGTLTCSEQWQPTDGNLLTSSIKETFPRSLHWKALNTSWYDRQLNRQIEAQAQEYLNEIGREAKTGGHGDFQFLRFKDEGMSDDAAHTLFVSEELSPYPDFIGTQETIEHNVRWVYQTAWDHDGQGNGTVTYTKYRYDDPTDIAQKLSCQVQGDAVTQLS